MFINMNAIYNKVKYYAVALFLFGLFLSSCADMNIPPLNVVKDQDVFANESTTLFYLTRLYSQMPFEDFKYSPKRSFFDSWVAVPDANDGQTMNYDDYSFLNRDEGYLRNGPYWTQAFAELRDANYLLENLPAYKANFSEAFYNHCIGEAYFTRAMVFYALAKRYGGVPLVIQVQQYPENPAAALEVPRSSEEETWNQVLSDFDQAINYLEPASPYRGFGNKDVALGFKSEAMLYAGTVAKYNRLTGFGQKVNKRLIGFDPATSAQVSNKYLQEAYNAARQIMKGGKYSLYMKKWTAGDREAQYQNMVDMFFDASSPENIYIKEYSYPDLTHGYDTYCLPYQLMGGNGYSSESNPPLDFVEKFDGLPKNADGTFKTFDDNGKYIMYDSPMDPFKNAEPRLRAYVVFPSDILKGQSIEIRRGTFTGDASNGIESLMSKNGVVSYALGAGIYESMDAYLGHGKFNQKVLYLDPSNTLKEVVTLPDGTKMNASGINGPFKPGNNVCAFTGFTVRKWINPNMASNLVLENHSTQSFILMRYAEILLNAAEAGAELKLSGVVAPNGDDFTEIAYEAIRDIRNRAGADPLPNGASDLQGQSGLQLIRKERQKELAYEHHNLWDIRRWRTQHSDVVNGRTGADGVNFRALYPFYSTQAKKWFFDNRLEEREWQYKLQENQYYLPIPAGEVSKSPVIDQQPSL